MESQDPLKGCAFVLRGHGWEHNFCLFEGSQEHSSSSHRVTVQKPFGERRRGRLGNDLERVVPERSSRCRGGGGESKVTHRPVLTERFWPRNLRRWGGPCSHWQAWAQSSAVLARASSHTYTHGGNVENPSHNWEYQHQLHQQWDVT